MGFSRTALIYLAFGLAVNAAYGGVLFTGWEGGTPAREKLPPGARDSPGGYRGYHFWHSGFQGGK
jgi:hypothetical protein